MHTRLKQDTAAVSRCVYSDRGRGGLRLRQNRFHTVAAYRVKSIRGEAARKTLKKILIDAYNYAQFQAADRRTRKNHYHINNHIVISVWNTGSPRKRYKHQCKAGECMFSNGSQAAHISSSSNIQNIEEHDFGASSRRDADRSKNAC